MKKEPDNSEEFRRACEARHLLRAMTDEQRQEFYKGAAAKRGEKAIQELVKEVKRQRRLARAQEMEI